MAEKHNGKIVKTNVRLFRAEDVVWFVLDPKMREADWISLSIDADGFELVMRHGEDKNNCTPTETFGLSWSSVAKELGFGTCEYVLNQDQTSCVFLYDEAPLKDELDIV